jgi:pilus assembly protein CpaB
MVQGMGFGASGYSRSRGQKTKRIVAVVGFLAMSALAIGVPLLSKPAVVVVQPKQEVLPTPIPMINVYMPVQRIPAGTQLSPVMFRVEGMSPVSLAALGGQPVKGEAELVGKYAKGLIMPGRPVMADQLMDAPDNQITRKIRPGYRAITIQVDNVSGIEGWGLPGTKVDVLWQSSAGEGEQIVTTIVKNAQILSVAGKSDSSSQSSGSSLVGGPAGAKGLPIPPNSHGGIGGAALGGGDTNTNFTVTLLVTPDDGQKIFLASRSGDMSLMLRGDFETASDSASQASVTSKRAMQGGEKKGDERVEGVAKARRSDGSIEEWSVIEGRVWRWDQAAGGTTWNR